MSAGVSSEADDGGKAVGRIEIHRAKPKAEGDNFYICRWNLTGKFTSNMKGELKSPIFAVPHREECKWYLSVQHLNDGVENDFLFFSMRLFLDSTSDCEAAVAKFRLQLDEREYALSSSSRTFKFIKKSENSAAMLTNINPENLENFDDSVADPDVYKSSILWYKLSVMCTIMIINVIPEDNSFPDNFGSLLKDKQFTDVALVVGRKKFQAHKVILSARSSVFAAMFAHNTTENQGVVNIKDIRKEVVEEMICYIYTGEVKKLNHDLAKDLLIAADKYDLIGLRSKCEGILIMSLSSSNAFDLLLFAESYNASKLKFEAINLIRMKRTEMKETPGWKSLSKSNPALVREISEAHHSKPESDSDTDVSYLTMSSSGSESE